MAPALSFAHMQTNLFHTLQQQALDNLAKAQQHLAEALAGDNLEAQSTYSTMVTKLTRQALQLANHTRQPAVVYAVLQDFTQWAATAKPQLAEPLAEAIAEWVNPDTHGR
jgi:hypothetical protein